MSSHKPIRAALLSYGMSGDVFHGPLLGANPGFEVYSVLQRSSDSAKKYFPSIKIVRTVEEIASDANVELVVVNTPNDSHFDFTKQMLEAGKHVVVEKPFTPTVAEGEKLISLAKKKGLVLSVFQNRRWDSHFLTVKKVVESGVLGKIVEFETHYDRFRNFVQPNTWKEEPGQGSGILYNLGSHILDQVFVLFGMPKRVDARIGIQRPGGKVDDFFDIRLDYPGLNVIVKSSYLVREPGPFFTIHGVNGSFVKFGGDPQEELLKKHAVPGGPGWGADKEKYWGKLNTELNGVHYEGKVETVPGNYPAYYQNIFDAIRNQAPLQVKAEEAVQVLRIIEAAVQSNKEGKIIAL